MKVLILEACRSPEVKKHLTEPLVLSQLFSDNGIDYELYSNDGIWTERVRLDDTLIRNRLEEASVDVVHFAVHGSAKGLVLRWSSEPDIGDRGPTYILTGDDIRSIEELKGKVVVSGACSSAKFADDFLAAGADAFVAPLVDVSWEKIGLFFKAFYLTYRSSKIAKDALNKAVKDFPQYNSYRVFER